MNTEEILNNLCYYDKRNPNNNLDGNEFDDEYCYVIDQCYCDNCFDGKTKLAKKILRLNEQIKDIMADFSTPP